jgi:hypothetical protein
MDSRLLMTLQVAVGGAQKIGAVPHGTRVTVPIASGHFEGPRLRGKVLPGGGTGRSSEETASSSSTCALVGNRRRRPHPHELVRTSSRAAGCDRGARARRERRSRHRLLPDDAPFRDRPPEVRVLESPGRGSERRSASRRTDLHDRRDPARRPWTPDEETFSSCPHSRRSLDADPCVWRLTVHHPATGNLLCDRVP